MPDPTREWITRDEALAILPVKPATLYTYVSRGLVRRLKRPGGRGSVFSREDVERLRAQSDAHASNAERAVAALRWGEPVISTAITELRPDGPYYRRLSAIELAAEGRSFEAVCQLLWSGAREGRAAPWPARDPSPIAEAVEALIRAARTPDLMKLFAAGVLLTPMAEKVGSELEQGTTILGAQRAIRALTGVCGLLRPERRFEPARRDEPVGAHLARALGLEPTRGALKALNAALVVSADHELAPGAFAARVSASAGADLYACLSAGICAHSGSVVGRACLEAEGLLDDLEDERLIPAKLDQVRSHGARLYGFSHPLYRQGDPRTQYLLELARTVRPVPAPAARAIAFLEQAAAAGAHAGLGVGLVVLAMALQAPRGTALAIWTVGRSAGLVAHVLEQRLSGYPLRPRARFSDVGP